MCLRACEYVCAVCVLFHEFVCVRLRVVPDLLDCASVLTCDSVIVCCV